MRIFLMNNNNSYDYVGKVIHWELCKRLKFDHSIKCTYKPESLLENETHNILWYIEIQTDHLTRPENQIKT